MTTRRKSSPAIPAILIAAALLSGCVTTGGARLEPLSASLAQSEAGRLLDRQALRRAATAEAMALESTPTCGTGEWRSGARASGTVSPGAPFEVSGRVCRRLTHRIEAAGNEQLRTVTACKDDENIWQPVGT